VESFNAATLFDEELVAGFNAQLGGIAFLSGTGLVGIAGASSGLLYLLGQRLGAPALAVSATSTIITASVTLSASASDGYGPYNFSYTGLPAGCQSANTSRMVCSPTQAGSFSVTVHVVDQTGATVSASASFVVHTPPVVPGIELASGAPATGTVQPAILGQNVTLTAVVTSSGVTEIEPATILNWTVAPITNGSLNTSHGPSVSVSFFDTGNFTVILTAFFDGTTNSSSVTFDVGLGTHSTPPGGSSGTPLNVWILVLVLVVAVVIGIAAFALSRRGGPGSATRSETEPEETAPAEAAAAEDSAPSPPEP
jgi:hypothetical protein